MDISDEVGDVCRFYLIKDTLSKILNSEVT